MMFLVFVLRLMAVNHSFIIIELWRSLKWASKKKNDLMKRQSSKIITLYITLLWNKWTIYINIQNVEINFFLKSYAVLFLFFFNHLSFFSLLPQPLWDLLPLTTKEVPYLALPSALRSTFMTEMGLYFIHVWISSIIFFPIYLPKYTQG